MAEDRVTIHELPPYWREQIRKLRVENSKVRRERNELREALEAVQNNMPRKAANGTGITT